MKLVREKAAGREKFPIGCLYLGWLDPTHMWRRHYFSVCSHQAAQFVVGHISGRKHEAKLILFFDSFLLHYSGLLFFD
jgi:hypothetical protein